MFIQTTCASLTGKLLYSDEWGDATRDGVEFTKKGTKEVIKFENSSTESPLLNRIARMPFVGILSGAFRCALAIVHVVGHAFAAIAFLDAGHFGHSLKGCAEFIHGMIEMIPIVGRVFAWNNCTPLEFGTWEHSELFASYFLVKIFNPEKIDQVDAVFSFYKQNPFLEVNESCVTQRSFYNLSTQTAEIRKYGPVLSGLLAISVERDYLTTEHKKMTEAEWEAMTKRA